MDFRSDNVAGVAPEIMAAVTAANSGTAAAYGDDAVSARLDDVYSALFETEVRVFPVVTGTVANALAVSILTPPYGAVYTHRDGHLNTDECGAPELFTGGAKLAAVAGEYGKIDLAALRQALQTSGQGFVHAAQPACVSLTQATEMGAVYTADEIAAIAALAREWNMAVHMDGARFANAVAASGASPAELTWRAGVDVLSFGATKNGALAAEAIVLFRVALADDLAFRHKRAGQLLSKMRFVSAQLEAYVADGLWLRLASHANDLARALAEGLAAIPGARLVGPSTANEIFVDLPEQVIDALKDEGFQYYGWPEPWQHSTTIRLVTRHDMEAAEVAHFLARARSFCAQVTPA